MNLCITAVCALTVRPRGGRGNSRIKVTGMLVVSLRSVNCRFRSQLGCLGPERHYTCPFRYRLGLCQKKFTKNTVMCFVVSLSFSHTCIGLPWEFHFSFPTSTPVTFIRDFSHPLRASHSAFDSYH